MIFLIKYIIINLIFVFLVQNNYRTCDESTIYFYSNSTPIDGEISDYETSSDNIETNDFISIKTVSKRSIYINKVTNWTSPIKYHIDKELKNKTIIAVLEYFSKYTCLNFTHNDNYKVNDSSLVFLEKSLCSSLVGKNIEPSGDTEVWLTETCSKDFGILAHEIAHALGLRHEHQRFDRDEYITIDSSLISNDYKDDIMKKDNDSQYAFYNITYDYGSIMHYPSKSSMSNEKQYIFVNDSKLYEKMIGQRHRLSFNDFKTLNHYYCLHKCYGIENKCKNGGYPYWNNCTRCVCPKEYTGAECSIPKNRSEKCNLTIYNANNTKVSFQSSGKRRCSHFIRTDEGNRIAVILTKVDTVGRRICRTDVGLEIKYKIDKGTTGLCLCGNYNKNITIISEGEEVVITYIGEIDDNKFKGHFVKIPKDSQYKNQLFFNEYVDLSTN
uniref:Metalloendopeptidase n=1 Tax=Parastrongyloides trichosuri TaxID=131310 RepID=A0A0N4ZJU7_PARTI